MRYQRRNPQTHNRSHQQQVAMSLIGSLGIDGAIEECYRNGWDGTLQVILKDERNH